MKNASVAAVVVIGLLGVVAGMAILNGFMLSYMWEWFVVPFGAPSIGILHSIGLAVLVSMLTYQGTPKAAEDDEALSKLFGLLFGKVVAFGLAFLVSFGVAA